MQFYHHVITDTPDMDQYGRWKIGVYPTEDDIVSYIERDALYILSEEDIIIGAMAVTMNQGEDYHAINWSLPLMDDAVSVIHILAINPDFQGKGMGNRLIDEAISIAENGGKKALRLDALASNTPAHHMYENKGFDYRGIQNLYAANTGWTDFYYFEWNL